jgi:hypothetical protein
MHRAEVIAREFIGACDRRIDTDDCIVTLDGVGNNRRAFKRVFAQEGLPCPRIITCEREPVVALCQRILYGDNVILTGGNTQVRSKKRGGCHTTPLLEDVIVAKRLPLHSIRVLYLDYCGGPPNAVDMKSVLSKLDRLVVYAATISRRQHPDLERTFEQYMPSMYGFQLRDVFLANRRVVCKMYARNAEPRNVRIPGCFWLNCPAALRKRKFQGVMLDETTAEVETERGLERVHLSKRAREVYAVA